MVEELLKAGELPCLVATSSLELGIDMGAVDLVLQVESPKSVTARPAAHRPRRPQRRRHLARAASSPSSAPTCSSARSSPGGCARARSRPTVVPRNPLDVLAQQIVAMAASSRRASTVDDLYALVTRTHSFAELSRAQLENVLDMLDGRYPSRSSASCARGSSGTASPARSAPARARARSPSPTPARSPTAACSRSTLPDGRRVGELDEEMVYEARPGQTFLLGASTWRIEEIGRDRVIVTPAPGVPGRGAVLEGRRRRAAAGAGRGDRRVLALGGRPGRRRRWRRDYDLDELAARNLLEFLREQQAATRVVPSDRTIVDRALPRRDRRLAAVRALALRRARARGLGARAERAHPRRVRPRVRRDLVRRRDHRPPPRRRRAARRRARADRPRRARGPRRRRARRLRAVRRALPRERRRARCSSRAPTRASARRCGSSG